MVSSAAGRGHQQALTPNNRPDRRNTSDFLPSLPLAAIPCRVRSSVALASLLVAALPPFFWRTDPNHAGPPEAFILPFHFFTRPPCGVYIAYACRLPLRAGLERQSSPVLCAATWPHIHKDYLALSIISFSPYGSPRLRGVTVAVRT